MRISSIHTYPVKGCYRIDHDDIEVEPWGLAGDRRWLIVDAVTCRAVTQRELPALTQIQPSPTPDGIILRRAGLPDLPVTAPGHGELVDVQVFGFTGSAALAGPAADDWLAAALSSRVRLVWLDDPTRRPIDPAYAKSGDTVSFADGFPVLLANTASLDSLNDLIAESGSGEGPLPMTRFRPNLVIAGAPAWAEDEWTGGQVRVGAVTFRVPKPCARCLVTTTDQETGERGREPLHTLGRHRNIEQKLIFATNLIPDGRGRMARGRIAVGDPVELR
jgi:uncharacterized protein YcbX